MDRSTLSLVVICAGAATLPPRGFIDRNPYHGQPRSIKETRRAQPRGRR